MNRTLAVLIVCMLQCAGPAAAAVPVPPVPVHATQAQAAPPQFLPWPPPVPAPPAASAGATLDDVLAALQSAMDRLRQWLEWLRAAAAAAAADITVPLPYDLPSAAAPLALVARLAALPGQWEAIAAAALAKLRRADGTGTAAQHAAAIAASPELSHEAETIATADEQIVSGALRQEIAVSAASTVAQAAAGDAGLPAAAGAAQAAGDRLLDAARNLPSSRAGIELLVAGTGAGLRAQGALAAAVGARLAGLIQQSAQLSSQVGALASTVDTLTERDLERDRNALDARMGVADAAEGAGSVLEELLTGAGEPADEIHLVPLY
jgi:hypothetical protein